MSAIPSYELNQPPIWAIIKIAIGGQIMITELWNESTGIAARITHRDTIKVEGQQHEANVWDVYIRHHGSGLTSARFNTEGQAEKFATWWMQDDAMKRDYYPDSMKFPYGLPSARKDEITELLAAEAEAM